MTNTKHCSIIINVVRNTKNKILRNCVTVARQTLTLFVGVRIPIPQPEKVRRASAGLFQRNLPFGQVKGASRVKYADACEIFAARKWANFISLCGKAAKFHVCRRASISHRAKARYFTKYLERSKPSVKHADPSISYFNEINPLRGFVKCARA